MFLIMCPDEPSIPEAPPAAIATYDRPAAPPMPRRPDEPAPHHPLIDELIAVFDEDAIDQVVTLILGESPHSAHMTSGEAVCLTCQTNWPCLATLVLIKSATKGLAAVHEAEGTFRGAL